MNKKAIKKVSVKVPGSPPDVDTDFHTQGRKEVLNYVVGKYGKDNVANIVTFGEFKAKTSIKALSTIYQIPFAQANKLTATIPAPVEGEDVSIADLLDENSERYAEGEDFRKLMNEGGYRDIIESAIPFDKRVRGMGTHACGIIISNSPIKESAPVQVRQADGALVTQWTYPQCESIGLIKMDFLGLDTLDIIENTLENIKNSGKEVPDMVELVRGEMNDPKTFEMLRSGETTGVFQLGSDGVKNLLKRAQPTEFMDIASITALFRPGPMSTNSHIEWADRRNGSKSVIPIDKGFVGTEVERILSDTAGIMIYQEQIMHIATDYAGMTPYESEKLRKAMGKKKMEVMMSMRPKFIDGAIENGSTEHLANLLWDTMVGFAQYGFNKSHSVSYAINAYKTAFLKANYPSEFMAALLQQNIREPKKISMYLQEAQSMGLKIGPVDINKSFSKMSAVSGGEYDIVYGFSGVKNVNEILAEEITKERTVGGEYKSMSDFLKRITARATINAGALKYLAGAGAFDSLGLSRLMVSQQASSLLSAIKNPVNQNFSLFDMIEGDQGDPLYAVDLTSENYSYIDKLKGETDSIGLFVSGHPVDNIGVVARQFSPVTLSKLKGHSFEKSQRVIATITLIDSKVNKAGKRSIAIRIDDGTATFDTFLPPKIVAGVEKGVEKERIKKEREKGKNPEVGEKSKNRERMMEIYYDDTIKPIYDLSPSELYLFTFSPSRSASGPQLRVTGLEKLSTAHDGSLPFEIIFPESGVTINEITSVLSRHKGNSFVKLYLDKERTTGRILDERVHISQQFIIDLEQVIGAKNILTSDL